MEKLLLYGKHAVLSALENLERKCYQVFAAGKIEDKLTKTIQSRGLKLNLVEKSYLDKITNKAAHQNIVLNCESVIIESKKIADVTSPSYMVILDQVTDTQNIGSIIRSACAFDASQIIMPKNNSPKENGAIAKASAGAIDKIKICKVVNISQTIKELKKVGYWVISLDSHSSTPLNNASLPDKCVFIFGSEGKGVRQLVEKSSDLKIRIPMNKTSESLNVASAASIVMHKFYSDHLT